MTSRAITGSDSFKMYLPLVLTMLTVSEQADEEQVILAEDQLESPCSTERLFRLSGSFDGLRRLLIVGVDQVGQPERDEQQRRCHEHHRHDAPAVD